MSSTDSSAELNIYSTSISYIQASLGVILAIGFGYGILYLTYILDNMFNWGLLNYFSTLYIIQVNPPNQLYFATLGFSFITELPTCFGWFFGGMILGIYSKKRNTHYNGVQGSWKSFQIAILAIELVFIGSAVYYIVASFIGSSFISISLLFGGLLLYLLTLFITPGFWASLALVLLGGMIGASATRSTKVVTKPIEKPVRVVTPKLPRPTVAEPTIPKAAEIPPAKTPAVVQATPSTTAKPVISKPFVSKPTITEPKPIKPTPPLIIKEAKITAEIPVKPAVIEEKPAITEKEIQITESVLKTGKCPKCKGPLQEVRISMIKEGKDTICPKCMQPIRGVITKPSIPKPILAEKPVVVPKITLPAPTKPPIVAKEEITESDSQITDEAIKTGRCPKCKEKLADVRVEMLKDGKNTFCASCLQVIKGKPIDKEGKPSRPPFAPEAQKKRDEIIEIMKVGENLLSEDKEKALAFFEDALELAKEVKANDLIKELEEITEEIRKRIK